ncbi:MAG: hypothetical protein KIH63_001110 [Candidatus Saccharibacteria bacterium]|nr:hypothetical protein [Candidatus Saccharibacteria bacterium]
MEHNHHAHNMISAESSAKEYAKFAIVVAAITVLSYVLFLQFGEAGLQGYLRSFMGIFFIVFATFKFIGYEMFAVMYAGYDIVAKRFRPYAYAYPFIELGLGLLYVFDVMPNGRDLLTLVIMAIGSIGVAQEMKKRSGIHCACLGNVIKLPLSTVSLVEDVGMGLMAAVMLALRAM